MDRHTDSDQDGQTRRGRPPTGAALVPQLTSSSDVARTRLTAILRTVSGQWTIDQACQALGLKRSRFHAMRARFLSEAPSLLEPRPPGPTPHVPTDAEREVDRLRARVTELELDVLVAQVREELAAIMPEIVQPRPPARSVPKKKRRRAKAKPTRRR